MPKVTLQIEVTDKGTIKVLDALGKKVKTVQRNTGGISKLKTAFTNLGSAIFSLKGAIVGLAGTAGMGMLVKSIASVGSQLENLRVRLSVLRGSIELANKAFKFMDELAKKVPFSLQEIADAGVILESFGANMEKWLPVVSDLAAAMGMDLKDAAYALGRAFSAGAGAADIFRERGILQIIKDFKGIDDLSKLTLPEFRQAMYETFTASAEMGGRIAGASQKMAKTLTGQFSMLQDAFFRLKKALSEAGIMDILKIIVEGIRKTIENLVGVVERNKEAIRTFFVFVTWSIVKLGEVITNIGADILTFFSALGKTAIEAAAGWAMFIGKEDAAVKLINLANSIEDFGVKLQTAKIRIQAFASEIETKLINILIQQKQETDKVTSSIEKLNNKIKNTTQSFVTLSEIAYANLSDLKTPIIEIDTELRNAQQSIQQLLQNDFEAGFVRPIAEAKDSLYEFGNVLGSQVISSIDQMSGMLADAFMGAKVSWKSFVRAFMRDITAMIMKMLILKALKTAFGIPFKEGGLVGFYKGGIVKRFQTGGLVPGVGFHDKIPALLTPEEFVIRRPIVKRYGVQTFEAINQGRMPMRPINIEMNISVQGNADLKTLRKNIMSILPDMLDEIEKAGYK